MLKRPHRVQASRLVDLPAPPSTLRVAQARVMLPKVTVDPKAPFPLQKHPLTLPHLGVAKPTKIFGAVTKSPGERPPIFAVSTLQPATGPWLQDHVGACDQELKAAPGPLSKAPGQEAASRGSRAVGG